MDLKKSRACLALENGFDITAQLTACPTNEKTKHLIEKKITHKHAKGEEMSCNNKTMRECLSIQIRTRKITLIKNHTWLRHVVSKELVGVLQMSDMAFCRQLMCLEASANAENKKLDTLSPTSPQEKVVIRAKYST